MDWEKEIIRIIDEYFKRIHVKYTPKASMNNCLVDYFNFELKLIDPLPRQVFKSDVLKAKKLPLLYSKALHEIELKIKKGEDLTQHQSKRAIDPVYTDDLLNDWVIYHFHLSTTKSQPNQKFYDRSKYLLFAVFSETQAFLIDVHEHQENHLFGKKELLEIMDKNWPAMTEPYYSDWSKVEPDCTDEEVELFRKKGYTVGAYNINGKVIRSPGIGIMTSGHNIQVVRKADEVHRYIYSCMQQVADEDQMKKKLFDKTGIKVEKLDLEIRQLSDWPYFALFEKSTKQYIEKDKLIDEALA